jgi:hypothetical protein
MPDDHMAVTKEAGAAVVAVAWQDSEGVRHWWAQRYKTINTSVGGSVSSSWVPDGPELRGRRDV